MNVRTSDTYIMHFDEQNIHLIFDEYYSMCTKNAQDIEISDVAFDICFSFIYFLLKIEKYRLKMNLNGCLCNM